MSGDKKVRIALNLSKMVQIIYTQNVTIIYYTLEGVYTLYTKNKLEILRNFLVRTK